LQQKLDYNSISREYNKRYSASPLSGIKEKLLNLVDAHKPANILEIGCGTGYWLSQLHLHKSKLYGLDLSKGMLKEAKKLSSAIYLVNADSDNIPFTPAQFDMIICVNAVHFFQSPVSVINNCMALLQQKGSLTIIGYDPFNPQTEWLVYKYFEGTFETDKKRYPRFEDLKEGMNKCGFQNVELELVENVCEKKLNDEVLLDPFIQHKGCSQLAALSIDDYNTGINKLKTNIENHKDKKTDLIFHTNLFFYSLTGHKI
jgi:ubiquinone/menaquinone biosynthesis C-methylase UbiE